MKALVLLLVLVIGVGVSFGQTDEEESGKLIVTITDENGNLIEVPSIDHVEPIVTDDSPPPPGSSDIPPPPPNLTVNSVQ